MSGGQLIVVDRYGRDVKRYQLAKGLATLGKDPACDIRLIMSSVSEHHATVFVHANQTFVRNIGDSETLVNGQPVSMSALCHGDMITIGGRSLRWEYSNPDTRRQPKASLQPALPVAGRGRGLAGRGRARRAGNSAPASLTRSLTLRLALEMTHRASMPGSAGAGKQVAIVQPQRRDTNQQNDKNPPRTPLQTNKRRTKNGLEMSTNDSESDNSKRKTTSRMSPKNVSNLQTTKATLWIESRKSSPRKSARAQTHTQVGAGVRRSMTSKKSTPLRLTVLKRAQSAHKMKVTKIEDPVIDHTKQVAIMLMTRHTPKKLSSPKSVKNTPSHVVKKPSPVRKTPASKGRKSARRSKENATPTNICVTPKRYAAVLNTSRRSSRRLDDQTDTVLEIADLDEQNITARSSNVSRHSGRRSISLPSPRKSALKDPTAKGNMRKTESIKFDLSNLKNQSNDVLLNDTTNRSYDRDSASDDELTLRYSDTSSVSSPSPRRSIHSRSSRMLEKSLGTKIDFSSPSHALTPQSPRGRNSSRGSIILQKAIDKPEGGQTHSRRSTKSLSDHSRNITNTSAYQTHTLSPRTRNSNNLESYSIVDLVSIDSDETGATTSVYNSAGSANNTTFGTPQSNLERKTRSSINPMLLGSSTPYVKTAEFTSNRSNDTTSSGTSNNISKVTARSSLRRSKSLSTPENTEDVKKNITVNSNKIIRPSKSRSRINDSDLLLVEGEDDDSPKSSKRSRGKSNLASPNKSHNQNSVINSPQLNEGEITPENMCSPEEATTPVLSIQSLLDSRHSSLSHNLKRNERQSKLSSIRRKTFGVFSVPKTPVGVKSKSLSFTARKTRLRLSSDLFEDFHKSDSMQQNEAKIVTPKSTVKLVHEGVKNKHSTAKKPQSKRAIIDDLNASDIVKKLFNSPVKRKLSQSMTEFSRKHLSDNDNIEQIKSPLGNTEATSDKTLENSILENMTSFTPERFVSPINTPRNSPNLTAIKRLFGKTTPRNDLENVRDVKYIRTHRTRRSVRNDLSDVTGVKSLFAKSPKNRLSDVRVKELFTSSPKNDLRRVTGMKTLFEIEKKVKSPRNDLSDVRGVKKLFQGNKSPTNDLRNVSGVKRALQRNSPRNDLTDVTGVKRIFRQDNQNQNNGLNDISGVEVLFNTSNESYSNTDILFDQLVGKPPIRAVYSKTFSTKLPPKKKTNRKSLSESLDLIANNVDEWLEQELQKRLHKKNEQSTSKVVNRSKSNLERELQKLATDTVEGNTQDRKSKVRNSTLRKSNERQKTASELYGAHRLPIKKRSLLERSNEKETNFSKITSLPIKKRAVIHSTPMKGRVNMTMNASELSRVSPIATVRNTNVENDNMTRTAKEFSESILKTESSKQGRRQTKTKNEQTMLSPRKTRGRPKSKTSLTVNSKVKPTEAKPRQTGAFKGRKRININDVDQGTSSSMSSPKKTRGRQKSNTLKSVTFKETKPSLKNPAKPRQTSDSKKIGTSKMNNDNQAMPSSMQSTKITRSRSKANNYKTNSSKTKFSPAKLSPTIAEVVRLKSNVRKGTAVANSTDVKAKSIGRTRATRSQKEIASPKNNAKKGRPSLVVFKKTLAMSPKLRSTRNNKVSTLSEVTGKRTRATRKRDVNENTPKITRDKVENTKAILSRNARKTKVDNFQKSPKESRTNTKTISKKAVLEKQESTQSEPVRKGTRAVGTRGKNVEPKASLQSEPPKRNRRTKSETVATVETRKRKIVVDNVVPTKVVKLKDIAESESNQDTVESTKRKRSVRSTRNIPTKDAKPKDIVENTGAKTTVRSTRGIVDSRGETLDTERETVYSKKKKSGKDSKVEITRQDSGNAERSTRSVRSKKAAIVADEQQEITGRKTRNTAESVSAVGKRKRKNTAEPSPAEASGKQPGGKRSRKAVEVASPAKPSRTRRQRADTQPEASNKAAGRSRRR